MLLGGKNLFFLGTSDFSATVRIRVVNYRDSATRLFWRTGSLDRESCQCTFVGFRWTLQILRQDYMKFTNALKKQIQVVELFSISFPKAKTAIFPQEHPVLCPDWYRQKFFRSFAAQVLAERKELELQSGMSDVKVFSKIRRINPQVGFTFLTFFLPEKNTHTKQPFGHSCLFGLTLLVVRSWMLRLMEEIPNNHLGCT